MTVLWEICEPHFVSSNPDYQEKGEHLHVRVGITDKYSFWCSRGRAFYIAAEIVDVGGEAASEKGTSAAGTREEMSSCS